MGRELRRLLAPGFPWAVCAVVAVLGAAAPVPFEPAGVPAGMLVLVVVQAIGVAIARDSGSGWARRAWWMALACTAMLAPVLALQTAALRTPFVALANGSAGPLLWLTAGTIALLGTMLLWAGSVSAGEPSRAALLWSPAAFLVPAMLTSGSGAVGGRDALRALALAFALAAFAAAVGHGLARAARLPLVAALFGAELVALLVTGQGPAPVPGQGRIVPVAVVVLLLTAAASIAVAPALAFVARRFGETAAAPPRVRTNPGPGTVPGTRGSISGRSAPPPDR